MEQRRAVSLETLQEDEPTRQFCFWYVLAKDVCRKAWIAAVTTPISQQRWSHKAGVVSVLFPGSV